ncbi:hypothetical protein CDD83_9511 [Cordyceps sp. RAO-2017]|nr:hypothetical protein CDD83_9511 [Cordyceps sp. RAO-2017]
MGKSRASPLSPSSDGERCLTRSSFAPSVLHHYLLGLFGMPVGELWDLTRLSAYCRKVKRYFFFGHVGAAEGPVPCWVAGQRPRGPLIGGYIPEGPALDKRGTGKGELSTCDGESVPSFDASSHLARPWHHPRRLRFSDSLSSANDGAAPGIIAVRTRARLVIRPALLQRRRGAGDTGAGRL